MKRIARSFMLFGLLVGASIQASAALIAECSGDANPTSGTPTVWTLSGGAWYKMDFGSAASGESIVGLHWARFVMPLNHVMCFKSATDRECWQWFGIADNNVFYMVAI